MKGTKMNKKPEVLENTTINSKIDLNLTKDDLIDMILEERIEPIEKELSDTRNKEAEYTEKVNKQIEKITSNMLDIFNKKYGKRIKQLKSITGNNVEYSYYRDGPNIIVDQERYKYETYDNGRHIRSKVVLTTYQTFQNCIKASIDFSSDINKGEGGSWVAQLDIDRKDIEKTEDFKELVKLETKRQSYEKQGTILEGQLKILENMGKRARTKVVKSLLESSEQGRSLLKKLPKFNHKLLKA
jgi:hypothetical protein